MAKSNPITVFFQLMVGLSLLVGLGYAAWRGIDYLAGKNEREAIAACMEGVRSQLRAPGTAIFPEPSDAGYIKPIQLTATSGDWIWTNYVDSENGFGALLRSDFVCTVDQTGYADIILLED